MKRIFYAAAIAAAAMLAFAGAASAADIMAGQNMLAGTVTATVTAPNLVVDISLNPGWCMTSSAVAAAYDGDGLPTTKKGNPIPGQFPFKTTYAGCVESGSYTIPLVGGVVDTPTLPDAPSAILVAAHVDLFSTESHTVSAVSHAGETVFGPLEAYAGPNDSAWAGLAKTAVVPTFASAGVWPTLTGGLSAASWITTATMTELPSYGGTITDDSWRKAEFTLNVPAGSFVTSGEVIAVTSDNAEEVWLNGTNICHDGILTGPGVDSLEWSTISPGCTFAPVAGANAFQIIWRNYGKLMGLNLSQAQNPNGLVYGVSINYYTPTNHNETGWAAGTQFEGSNWASYFTVPFS